MPSDIPVTYRLQPKPAGYPLVFRLESSRLTVDSGRRVDEVALADVLRVRLTLEPQSLGHRALRARLWLRNGRTLNLSSLTWTGMIAAQRQDAEYGRFVRELLARIGRANPRARIEGGKPPWIWRAMVALAAMSFLAVTLFVLRAALAGQGVAALLGLLVGVAGAWQVLPLIRFNRPRAITSESPPADLVP